MNLLELIAVNLAVTCTLMLLLWLESIAVRDASIIDAFWGPGFIVIAAVTFVLTEEIGTRNIVLLAMTAVWGGRLALYLGRRNIGEPEDYRYRAMRDAIGPNFWLISLFVVFGLQALLMNIVALPLITGQLTSAPFGWLDAIGLGCWLAGFAFESIGDAQLARFKANPANRGKVFDRGLWRYTRHPNYFGDFLVWWGIYLVSIGNGEHATWSIIGPIVMSVLLMRVSGVTLLERTLRVSKPGYQDYVLRTNAFFPGPPRAK